ncbi:MAG TPA: enterotoxin [bacterium]|nr:enterotoxin [bacterium]
MNHPHRTILFLMLGAVIASQAYALDFPGPNPGVAHARMDAYRLALDNDIVSQEWRIDQGSFRALRIADRLHSATLELEGAEAFRIVLQDGTCLNASQFQLVGKPIPKLLKEFPDAAVLARHSPGRALALTLVSPDGSLQVNWQATLRDNSNAIRQEITLTAAKTEIPIRDVVLVEIPPHGVEVSGVVPGSPMVSENMFFAYEHPNATSSIQEFEEAEESTAKNNPAVSAAIDFKKSHAWSLLTLDYVLKPKESTTQSSVVGVVPQGQMRRGFLYYLERERAHPYRPFPHYNSWYDISWANLKFKEEDCLKVVNLFGEELNKRNIALDSYVWDDGWDNPATLWRPLKENFPNGFSTILETARQYDSALGFWMSPFGGYGQAATDRYTYGAEQGFEFKNERFALSGPKYYTRFLETCTEMIRTNNANFFKFDGLTQDIRETEAMLRLTQALRKIKPDLFISITTGTWPSPFWLKYGDSTWRGGDDMGFSGEGSKREQWINYRDTITYRNVVSQSPLYPINSLMNQGFAHATHGPASEMGDSAAEIRREIRSLFACGTCLLELYVTPGKLKPQHWDDLAEAIFWNRQNADVLVDTHWIGGDPGEGEPYGWASWTNEKAILAVRNPRPESQKFTLELAEQFQIPPDAPRVYILKSPWKSDTQKHALEVPADSPYPLTLEPFEVVVYEAFPKPESEIPTESSEKP